MLKSARGAVPLTLLPRASLDFGLAVQLVGQETLAIAHQKNTRAGRTSSVTSRKLVIWPMCSTANTSPTSNCGMWNALKLARGAVPLTLLPRASLDFGLAVQLVGQETPLGEQAA
jgi:hypothetical protein